MTQYAAKTLEEITADILRRDWEDYKVDNGAKMKYHLLMNYDLSREEAIKDLKSMMLNKAQFEAKLTLSLLEGDENYN